VQKSKFKFLKNLIFFKRFSLGPKKEFFGFLLPISTLWLQLLAVAFLQWFCIMFVYRLNASIDSLSVTLGKKFRK